MLDSDNVHAYHVREHLNSGVIDLLSVREGLSIVILEGKSVVRGRGLGEGDGKSQSLWHYSIKQKKKWSSRPNAELPTLPPQTLQIQRFFNACFPTPNLDS